MRLTIENLVNAEVGEYIVFDKFGHFFSYFTKELQDQQNIYVNGDVASAIVIYANREYKFYPSISIKEPEGN